MKKFEEKTLHSESIYEGKIINVRVDEVSLPDGKTSKRELVGHPGAVAVIALNPNNELVLVEQYRKPMEKSIIEIPAGKLEKGEDPKESALRELEEETGYTTENLEYVLSFYTSPGFSDEIVHLYFSDQLEKMEKQAAGDDDEFVELLEVELSEALKLEKEERIHDAKTSYALLYLKTKGQK